MICGWFVFGVLLFIFGFMIVFIFYIVFGGIVGVFLLQWGDLIICIFGVVIIVMGLVFFGFFGFVQKEFCFYVDLKVGIIGVFFFGVVFGIGWVLCMGLMFVVIFVFLFNVGDLVCVGFLGLVYLFGFGILFLFVVFGFGWVIKVIGFFCCYICVVNIVGGVMLILFGVLMVIGFWIDIMFWLMVVIGSVIFLF